uniref:Uncharacterized protein n=1 Tax=Arundo donax TaxID=35708 RepID=A0A0A8Z3T0_ARUDO
MGGELDRAAI